MSQCELYIGDYQTHTSPKLFTELSELPLALIFEVANIRRKNYLYIGNLNLNLIKIK